MSSQEGSCRLFNGAQLASAYKKYRPNYNGSKIPGYIITFMEEKHPRPYNLAVDLGCGSGQATHLLSSYFDNVIGVDCSETQIKEAKESNSSSNVTFRCGDAHNLSFIADNSVDLVSCAESIHWMDLDALYKEVDRILKPGGCLAVYAYSGPSVHVKDEKTALEVQIQTLSAEIYAWIRQHESEKIAMIHSEYEDLKLPYGNRKRYSDVFYRDITVSGLMGFVHSTSTYHRLIKEHPEEVNVLQDYKKRLLDVIGQFSDNPSKYQMKWAVKCFLLMSRKAPKHEI